MINKETEYFKKSLKYCIDLNNINNSNILITGATGLIGSVVSEILLQANEDMNLNNKIYLSSRKKENLEKRFKKLKDKYISVEYDSNEEFQFFDKIDYIIHCASNASPLFYSTKPVETIMTNVNGTNNLLKWATKNNIKRFLYVSSSEVYGNKDNNDLFKEDDYFKIDILNSRACYPVSKRLCETLCSSYTSEYNMDIVIVRPGHIYGPNFLETDNRASAEFARNVINGDNIVMKSEGMQLRSYTHVIDCATAILSVLAKGKTGEAYNISNMNSNVTIRDFAMMHAKLAGTEVIFKLPTNEEKKGYNLMNCSALDSTKLINLGWNPIFDLESGVKHTIDILESE